MSASTLYLEHFQLKKDPFDQEPDTSIFYPAAGRKTVLKNLVEDIEKGKPLVKLTGSEGTGKTLMCRLLEKFLKPERYRLISFEHPIGSYENLLRTVCLDLGTVIDESEEVDETPPDYLALFKAHIQRIETEGKSLILIVDEAENLFLATLERLMRLLCEFEGSNSFQVVLVGRLELNANLDQLAVYCASVDINAGHTLEPLSMEETKQYIQFRLKNGGIPGDKYLVIFNDDAIDALFQTALGNISLTNSLAEQGLKKASTHGMFQVDDELIQPPPSIEENVSLAFFQGFDFLKDNKWWLVAGILLVWVVLVLFLPSGEKQETEFAGDKELEIITPEQEIIFPPESPPAEIVKEEDVIPADMEPVAPEKRGPGAGEREPVMETRPVEESPEVVVRKKEIVVEPAKRKMIVPPEQFEKELQESPPRDAEALFDERVKASSTWLAWAYRGGYTVQLMVLASDTAEENLKSILVDDKYYEIKDQLFILRKISPQTIYVFHGNYPSMEKAREARNRMPPFLKEIQPYALSIRDALKKIEK